MGAIRAGGRVAFGPVSYQRIAGGGLSVEVPAAWKHQVDGRTLVAEDGMDVFLQASSAAAEADDRLTHTLETTGISRGVARALRLNEDLVEAIGLGHDLGHTPFGHAGEEALDEPLRERFDRRFRHNEHSLRIVDVQIGRASCRERV